MGNCGLSRGQSQIESNIRDPKDRPAIFSRISSEIFPVEMADGGCALDPVLQNRSNPSSTS